MHLLSHTCKNSEIFLLANKKKHNNRYVSTVFSIWSQRGPGSVVSIATGYGLDGPGIESRWGARFSAPVQTGPGAHPASCAMGTGSFLEVKSSRGVTLTPHPLLVPWSWKSRAIPLLPLWAIQPVQSLSACTRVHFTFIWSQLISYSFYPEIGCGLCLQYVSVRLKNYVVLKPKRL